MKALTEISLIFDHAKKGKVRNMYDLGDHYLMVATDRISAFNRVLANGIPEKGKVLTEMSKFWFKFFDRVENHWEDSLFPDHFRIQDGTGDLESRSMIVKKTNPLPVECVVRGRLVGSAWKEYQDTGGVCGMKLPKYLVEGAKLKELLFTPSTKEKDGGHDKNITFEEMCNLVGTPEATYLRDLSLYLFSLGSKHTEEKGLILADWKTEFGWYEGRIILIDEIGTPDSSRLWVKEAYEAGQRISLDKQPVRNYLETTNWNKEYPSPTLPEEVVTETNLRYKLACELITDKK